jgi:hypothetical protein
LKEILPILGPYLIGKRLPVENVTGNSWADIPEIITVDNHVPSAEFNILNHTVGLLLSRNRREVS